MKRNFLLFGCLFFIATALAQPRPNIVLIYADDLGYGDISAYGATKVSTPNIDKLAQQGLSFTNAHASSATCTLGEKKNLYKTNPAKAKELAELLNAVKSGNIKRVQ